MENLNITKHKTFYSIGLSYKKADAEVRGKFSLDSKAKTKVLLQAVARLSMFGVLTDLAP